MTIRFLGLLAASSVLGAAFTVAQPAPSGRVAAPLPAPSDPDVIAFVRHADDGQTLHIYHHATETTVPVAVRSPAATASAEGDPLSALFDRPLAAGRSRYTGDLAWRPVLGDRGRQWFAFVSSEGADGYDLYLSFLDRDGTPAPPPLHLAQRGLARSPAWSDDGRHLAYVQGDDMGSDIHLLRNVDRAIRSLDARDLKPAAITTPYTNEFFPSWAPGGDLLAVQQQAPTARGMRSGLAVLHVGDDAPDADHLLALDVGLAGHDLFRPTFSPDGTTLAFFMTQSRIGEPGDERQDIGLLRINRAASSGRIQDAVVLTGVTPRIATNVLPHTDRGPAWTGDRLLTVLRDAAADNPIVVADVDRWRDGRPGHLRPVENLGTVLHQDPAGHASGRLAYISHADGSLRLQVRDLPDLQQTAAAVPVALRQRTAVFRSLALPGLGQWYKGQRGKARLALVGTGLTVASTVGMLVATQAEQARLDDIQASRAAYATQAGALPGTAEWWSLRNRYRFDDKRASKDRVDGLRTVLMGHLGLLAGLWTVGVIDAATGFPRIRLQPATSATLALRPALRLDASTRPVAALDLSVRW